MSDFNYVFHAIDITLINNGGKEESCTVPLPDGFDTFHEVPKSLFRSGGIKGAAVEYVAKAQKYMPEGVKLSVNKTGVLWEAIYDSPEVLKANLLVTFSREYAARRYKTIFDAEFNNTLLHRRRSELSALYNAVSNHFRHYYPTSCHVSNYGILIPNNEDSEDILMAYSELGLKKLKNMSQRYTLAKTLTDMLNNTTKSSQTKYETKATRYSGYLNQYPDDIIRIYITVIKYASQSNTNRNRNLVDW